MDTERTPVEDLARAIVAPAIREAAKLRAAHARAAHRAKPSGQWPTTDPWPTELPGVPA